MNKIRDPIKSRIVGQERFLRSETRNGLNYHMADKCGRMYWCGCMKHIRIAGRQFPVISSPGWRFIVGKRKTLKGSLK